MARTQEVDMYYQTDLSHDDVRRRALNVPTLNQEIIVGAVDVARDAAKHFYDSLVVPSMLGCEQTGFCGVYLIGSFATEDALHGGGREATDVDLLIVDRMHFARSRYKNPEVPTNGKYIVVDLAALLKDEGFTLEPPQELPTSYNIGHVAAECLLRAVPKTKVGLPMIFNMVYLNDLHEGAAMESLSPWLAQRDVSADVPLARVPLLEVAIVAH